MPDYTHAVYTSVKNTWQDAENLDDEHGYVTYIWIPEETYKVDLMKLHIYSEQFRAYSKTVKAGGAVVKTSSAGGAHSHNVTLATSSASSESTTVGGGAHSHNVTLATSSASSESTTVGGGSHSHGVTGTTSTENEAGYATYLPSLIGTKYCLSSNERTTGGPSATTLHGTAMFQNCPSGHPNCQAYDIENWYCPTTGHTHEIPSLETFIAIRSYMSVDVAEKSHTHNISGQTASAVGNHTHGMAHTHTVSGQTASAVGTHTHGMAHTHTVSGQTASAVGNHTHTVTLIDHTHEIDFGIYEEDITGRTLSAILYDPDGNELEDFGVVLTGEDSDIIDLTDHFETMKYGMYKMVLSASGRLRARLVFYELCKMYAQY